MQRFALLWFLIVCFSLICFGQKQNDKEQIIDVNFCGLVKNPADYAGKTIRVTAIYRFGYEWEDLYCPGCGAIKVAWDDFDKELTPKKYRKLVKWSEAGKTLKVTFVGRFEPRNRAENQINVRSIESAKMISKSSSNYEFLPEKDKAKASCNNESKQN